MKADASNCVEERPAMARVLVLTTGSNSVKWTVLAADKTVLADGSEPWAAEDSAAPERISSGRVSFSHHPVEERPNSEKPGQARNVPVHIRLLTVRRLSRLGPTSSLRA